MKFELNGLDDYSDESLLNEVRRVAELVNEKPLRIGRFKAYSKVSDSTLRRRFGGWKKVLLAAGLSEESFAGAKQYSKSEVIDELRSVSKKLNRNSFTKKEFQEYSSLGAGVASLRRHFGTFNKAMEAAGFEVVSLGKRYTDEECFENLLEVWTYYGRQPKHAEMKKSPSVVGPKAYLTRWGTWRKALLAFVERVNQDLDPVQEELTTDLVKEEKLTKKRAKTQAESREIRLGLRYDILKRDNFKCAICGRSPATDFNCKLHIDHIEPWSKGGLTVPENLQTLCDACNLGKGAKV